MSTTYYRDNKEFTTRELVDTYYKGVSLPQGYDFTKDGAKIVFSTPKPECGELEQAIRDGVTIDAKGNTVQAWKVVDMFKDYADENGIVHTKAEQEADYLQAKFKATVPTKITPRQLRLALLQATLLDEVEAMVASDRAMGIWWEYSLDIERDNEYIVNAGTTLGLTERQVDEMFILGGTL